MIYSNCLGALGKVATLPPTRIHIHCKHSNILKTVMIHCRRIHLLFTCSCTHVKAHHTKFHTLSRSSQAKLVIYSLQGGADSLPKQETFSLVWQSSLAKRANSYDFGFITNWPVLSSTTGRFYFQMNLTKLIGTLSITLSLRCHVSVGACKQVSNIPPTNLYQSHYHRDNNTKCPSCGQVCAHVKIYKETGRVDVLTTPNSPLERCLIDNDTDSSFCSSRIRQKQAKGMYMSEITHGHGPRFY